MGMKAINSYGMSELMGPGVAMECLCQDGMHIWEDHFIPQIIDPATGEVLPDGAQGELVVTDVYKRQVYAYIQEHKLYQGDENEES